MPDQRAVLRRTFVNRGGVRIQWFADPISMEHEYYVYITTNKKRRPFYTGVTDKLKFRTWQHKNKVYRGFTSTYNLDRLVWFESYRWIHDAIAREKQIKGWTRKKKIALIETMNPGWKDLYDEL